jgi:hypothetical protein
MKKIIFIILWAIITYVVGLAVFAIYAFAINPLPPHADVKLPEVQHQVMSIGFVSLIFTILLPIVALILGICGVLPGTHRRKDFVQI